jgi:BMFP domain-containing protein YqiC
MSIDEAKTSINTALQQNAINVLVQSLAETRVENEALKKRIAELEAEKKPS